MKRLFSVLLIVVTLLTVFSSCAKRIDKDNLADGNYTCEVTLSGGTGRAKIESPVKITVKNGKVTALITWSSNHYEYIMLGEDKYLPINTEGNSTFELPIEFDREIAVSALTNAMSEPHLIDYTIKFNSQTLKAAR